MSQPTRAKSPPDAAIVQQLAETSDLVFRFAALDPERILYANPAFERTWGRPVAELYGRPTLWLEAIHEADRAGVERAYREWLSGERALFEAEYRVVLPGGELRWILDEGTQIRSPQGDVLRVCLVARDTTLRRQAEAALRESESRYRSVIESMSEGIIIIDREGTMWACNPAAETILGLSRSELIGSSVIATDWGAIHEDGSPFDPADYPIVRTVTTGEPLKNVMLGLSRPTGELRWLSINTQPIREPGAESPLAAVASFQDITERKQVQEQIIQAHELVNAAIDASPEAIMIIDLETRVRLWNRAAEEIFGWQAGEVTGQPLPIIPPEAKASFEEGLRSQMEQGGTFKNQEAVRQRRDGSRVPVNLSTAPLRDKNGRTTSILGILSDITERKAAEAARDESEERFRQLAEHIESVFWLMEWPSGRMLYVSPAYERLWGRSSQSLYDDPDSWCAAVHPDDRERVQKYFQETVLSGSSDQEYRVEHTDGEVRWVRDRAFPVRNRQGVVYRVAGIASDVTERRRYEEQLRQHDSELAHVARVSTLGEMAAQLAHELNQPLYAISNYAEACATLVKSGTPCESGEVLDILRRIQGLSQRAAEIMKRMQQFARRHDPASEAVDLNDIVNETLALVEPIVHRAKVRVKLCLMSDLPPVLVDPILIQQVLVNLVCNSVESMEETPVAERLLSVRTQQLGEDWLQVSVADAGRGLPAGREQEMFEPFFTTKAEGLGMGLAISKSTLELHGGRLWAENNRDGRGATFYFTLPVAPAE